MSETELRAAAVEELQSLLLATPGIEKFVAGVAAGAAAHIAPRTHVGITLRRTGHAACVGYDDPRAARCDEAEYLAGEGPCLTAMDEGELVLVRDVEGEDRFPSWRGAVAEQGFRSGAGVPAAVAEGVDVAVDLYSEQPDAWSPEALDRAAVYADEVARALRLCLRTAERAQINDDLRAALASRAIVDQARGIVMARHRCSAEEASEILLAAAHEQGLPLTDVATALVAGVSGRAPAEPKGFRDAPPAQGGGGAATATPPTG